MSSYLIRLFYLGNRYHGSQIQPGFRTVAGNLVDALQSWSGLPFTNSSVQFAGRTDRGVHSIGQVVRIDSDSSLNIDKINRYLPDDIVIWARSKIPSTFHPRYDVLHRHYRYYIRNHSFSNFDSIQKELQSLIGTNDFRLLSKPDGPRTTTITMLNACISSRDNPLSFDFVGNSFLWKMIRKIVTVLKDIGSGYVRCDAISRMLDGDKIYPGGIQPSPPESLVLVESVVPFIFTLSKYAIRKALRTLNDYSSRFTRTLETLEFIKREITAIQRQTF
ncbi:MAG: tRNA pseudouridine(38-40) synthase TruA [Candidatus Lokiarchaeota archaeon]|nr:tRNA pseudouridine(38-40) synthase TruA [Candidatus Lokiarchaeota archaeon]